MQGTLVLKHPSAPRGVRVRFNGTRRVAVTSGAFDDETQRTKVIFRLPAPSHYVDIALRLRAGSTRVEITDDHGADHDTGDMDNTALGPDDAYRLKLRAIKVKALPVPGLFDDIRISRRTDTGFADTTQFVYDQGGRLMGEYNADGTPIVEYVYLANQPLAMLRGGAIYYYHTDHLDTPEALTDQDRRLVWRADYTPFGNTTISENKIENPLRFPGQYFDQETGLHYNYFRDYDPSTGRYIESDPTGLAGGDNTYLYGRADPISLFDSTGSAPKLAGRLHPLVAALEALCEVGSEAARRMGEDFERKTGDIRREHLANANKVFQSNMRDCRIAFFGNQFAPGHMDDCKFWKCVKQANRRLEERQREIFTKDKELMKANRWLVVPPCVSNPSNRPIGRR
jgi:RHS repeat-associated protein